MSNPIQDGGPAFPTTPVSHGYDPGTNGLGTGCGPGMTLRDWFAGQALIGLLGARNGFLVDIGTDNAPGWAYRVADGMIKERQKEIIPDETEEGLEP